MLGLRKEHACVPIINVGVSSHDPRNVSGVPTRLALRVKYFALEKQTYAQRPSLIVIYVSACKCRIQQGVKQQLTGGTICQTA